VRIDELTIQKGGIGDGQTCVLGDVHTHVQRWAAARRDRSKSRFAS